MKKLFIMIISVALAFSLTACLTINVVEPEKGAAESTQQAESGVQQEGNDVSDSAKSADKEDSPQNEPQQNVDPQTMETDYALYEKWANLIGYWNYDGHFILPDMADSHSAVFMWGMWDTEYFMEGRVVYMYEDGEYNLTAHIDAEGEQHIISLDYSEAETGNRLTAGIDDSWNVYSFAGFTDEEAYQNYLDNNGSLHNAAAKETDPALYAEWKMFECYWNAQGGDYLRGSTDGTDKCYLSAGKWESNQEQTGIVTYMYKENNHTIVAEVDFDGVTETFVIDYEGYDNNDTIRVKAGNQWREYKYAGTWSQLAYDSYLTYFKD